eukprot:m.9177 g.9177  ORF g.9177 m.9177 type:complete len:1197 (+) comp5363_c0_seq1:148-3738(+)
MYIKQVTIQGFKSYRDQTFVEPFSPHHNVVVGRNGSGKSNFFFAIRFVLSDMFSTLRAEERQMLLHEGTGVAVLSAYVEIVFDNTDMRIPVEKEEVVLRRAIGLKKDEYFLDGKHVTKTDVANLLESSGFSRSNPYYIVQQGKINSLALAKDSERLQLLKEVAGTSVYDERRAQSIGILEESHNKQARIEEVLGYIEQRLQELEGEKEELKQYQELDKDHRSIEYTLYSKELDETRAKLEQLETERQAESEKAQSSFDAIQEAQTRMKQLEDELAALRDTHQFAASEKRDLEEERQELLRARTKLELDSSDLETALGDARSGEAKLAKDIKDLTRSVKDREKQRDTIEPQFREIVAREKGLKERLEETTRRRDELYAKQSRSRQFRTQGERDKWLNSEIKSLKQHLGEKRNQVQILKKEIAEQERLVASLGKDKTDREEQLVERRQLIDQITTDHAEKRARADALGNERKEAWRGESVLEKDLLDLRERLNRAFRDLSAATSRAISQGLESVHQLQNEHKMSGVYGPLIELIDVDDNFMVPADVAGGNSLFNIVVDTDATASRLFQLMNKRKMPGRVTFLPLNRLNPKELKYPDDTNVIPLISKLKFSDIFRPAVLQIFGRVLVCRNMQIASQYARGSGFDGITLDGDKVNRKGVLQGGWVDTRAAKIALQREMVTLREQVQSKDEELGKSRKVIAETDQTISTLLGETERLQSRLHQTRTACEHLRSDIASLVARQADAQAALEQKRTTLETLNAEIARQDTQLTTYQSEIGTDMQSQLDDDDVEQIRAFSEDIDRLKTQLMTAVGERSELEAKKNEIELDLSSNLRKRLAALQQDQEERDVTQLQTSLAAMRTELQSIDTNVTRVKHRLEELEGSLAQNSKTVSQRSSELEDLRAKERERLTSELSAEKTMEQILNKRSLLLQKKEECMRKIRELGSLPAEAFSKYQKTSMKELYRMLADCNKQLKKFSHVNKKALDQYVSFSQQRDDLFTRKQEQDTADAKIKELVAVLDGQKDEAIERTFKQVAKNFAEVFRELVPDGRASLVMQRRRDGDEEGEAEAPKAGSRIEQYVGVAIKVSFTGSGEETHLVQQLSGGQKTVVALALIFAIQRCDPAPFYLFDEIDQALDATHRTAVAEMIHKMSREAQFITTTFRPELLAESDKYYGVTYGNKVSHIKCVTKEQALEFIEEESRKP